MRLAVIPVPSTRPDGMLLSSHNLPVLLDVARQAEDAGLDDLAISEHVVMAHRPDKYPFGAYPHRFDEPWPEPLTTLAALAAVTRRLRLITGIVIAPLRPPVLLAKQAATLHALSGGRFVMGVSTSWHEEEYAALGVPFAERGARLDDLLGACRALWGQQPASYSSPSISFEDLLCVPRPDHPDDIPIWIGSANTPRMRRRVVRYGQGWMPFVGPEPRPFQMMADGVRALQTALAEAGRDPAKLEVAALLLPRGRGLEQALEEDAPRFEAAGVTMLRVQMSMFVDSLEAVPAFLAELRRRFDRVLE
jgi:probable F420-dependent oxidoreductase